MTDLTFRPATPADIPALTDIWDAGWHQGHAETAPPELTALRTRQSFAERIAAHLPATFLSESGGAIAGFVMLEGNEIYQFYVARPFQGTDVARRQMAEAERRLAATGHCDVWLACGLGNARAARFYGKCGWENVGRRREEMETSAGPFALDIIRFEKSLA
ncbi:GNAT family N-acetyltransferase [Oceaniglobus roseus]|uniref:GNAT family N-acetyltransferase n=1 Tax=Oceaniglobus roseus TaxID=1737570 RepID=UPI000C7EE2E4|nr:GNAT family N-acetyltransferase [Kandeliimicrobium roseum]